MGSCCNIDLHAVQIIDLTHTIRDDIQIVPGDPVPSINRFLTYEQHYCHVDALKLGSHTGTHIDAPYHFFRDGKRIDQIPVERFVGNGILIDVSAKLERELIEASDVESYATQIQKGDFVIFMTGWDKYFGSDKYFQHPCLSADCAKSLLKAGVSLVATDAISVDPIYLRVLSSGPRTKSKADEDGCVHPVHDILSRNNILIVENLCNLDRIKQIKGVYSFLPLKLKDSDGSPVRAVYFSAKTDSRRTCDS